MGENAKKHQGVTWASPGLIMTSLHTSASYSITISRHMFHMISGSNLKRRMLVCGELEFLFQYDMVVHIEFHLLSPPEIMTYKEGWHYFKYH
jgi:hypothetical protein